MLKLGDKVRVRRDIIPGYNEAESIAPLREYVGREGVIDAVHNTKPEGGGYYCVQFANDFDHISGAYLDAVATSAEPPAPASPTLRDQFAMIALPEAVRIGQSRGVELTWEWATDAAYIAADAMLKSRDKTSEQLGSEVARA